MTEVETVLDSGAVTLAVGTKNKMKCCDCGLVHDFIITILDDETVEFAFRIDDEETGRVRRAGDMALEMVQE